MAEMQRYGNNCNSYLVANAVDEGKHLLVDPGQVVNEVGQKCLNWLVAEMRKDGIKVEDMGLIIVTHVHPDHYGAAEEIKKRSGALIAMGEVEHEFFTKAREQMSGMIEEMGLDIPEIKPDVLLKEGELRLSQQVVARVLLTPGHSPGHIGIYWPATRVYIGGDVIFSGNTGRVDIPGASGAALKASIEKIARLDIEYLLTGHQYESPGVIKGRESIRSNFEFVRRNVFPYL